MPFDLEIEFVGLCLFVPEPAEISPDGDPHLHVLMPKAGTSDYEQHGAGECGQDDPVPLHLARLCFDTAYTCSNSTPDKLQGFLTHVPLDRYYTGVGGSGLTFNLPSEVVKLGGGAVQNTVKRDLLRGLPAAGLTARVMLDSGSTMKHENGHVWNFAGVERNLSHRLTWKVSGLNVSPLELRVYSFDGLATKTVELYPIGGKIVAQVYHVPAEELPPDRPGGGAEAGTKACHFAAYFPLFTPPVDLLVPVYVGPGDDDGRHGGRPYTCMTAQGDPEPAP